MTEKSKNNNQNDQPEEEQKPSDETQSEHVEISREELDQILENHKIWLESDGEDGVQAYLGNSNLNKADLYNANLKMAELTNAKLNDTNMINANLQKARLHNAELQRATLAGANLFMASLNDTNLQNAYLYDTNLQNANLTNAKLHGSNLRKSKMQNAILDFVEGLSEANLKYANLEGATGLLGNEFAQADVTGTKLPDDIKEFKALETVKETSQNARKIFFAMLLGCVYSWLTIATTTDVGLLTNTASSPLPIIRTEIPIAWFYIAAPLIIICLYFYFHLYLLKLWEGLAGLPAIFPDGKRLDERAYPWLLNGLVRRHFRLLKTDRPFIAHVGEWITIFLAWWVVPITMIAFWLRFIPRHDWKGTIFHIGIIVLSVAFAIIFYRLCALTLQGKEKTVFRLQNFWKDRRYYYGVSVIVIGILFSLVSYGAVEGDRPIWKNGKVFFSGNSIKDIVPLAFEKIGYNVFADFREKIVSEIPTNYGLLNKEERIEFVKGADLKKANLKFADMFNAFLVKADLRFALLNGTNLSFSNLHKANLAQANLQKAILERANLQEANLSGTNLQKSYLYIANLRKANLHRADLQGADLRLSNLQGSYLRFSKLQQADLSKSYLQQADLMYSSLSGATFRLSNLNQAILTWADLDQANFENANLHEASFDHADLTGAKNLAIEQLSKVKTLYKAKLDPELLEQVKKCCPHLLEEPKEETDKTK